MNLQDFSVLRKKIERIKNEQELQNLGHAFGYAFLEEFYPDIDDITEILTEGKDDLGIDAINIDSENNTIEFFQFKFTEKYENKDKKIQDADLDKLSLRIKQIFNKEKEILAYANPRIKNKIERLWEIIENISPQQITAFFVTNYIDPIDENRRLAYASTLRQSSVKLEIYDSKKTLSLLVDENVPSFDTKIKFSGKQYFEKSDVKVKTVIGSVSANNLIENLLNSEGELEENVFDHNVRIYLKRKVKINEDIYQSSINNGHHFFYFNNGITITCEDFDYVQNSDSPVVEIKNIQIVNGSQTVHSLYEVYRNNELKNKLSDVYVLLRVYATQNKDLGQDIARYTNTQNPVRYRDTRSNDARQKRLETDLKFAGYFYQRKKNQYLNSSDMKDKVIDSERIGQIILAFYLEKPGDAKNKKSVIFDREYENIFDVEKLNSDYVITPFLLYNKIEEHVKLISKQKKELGSNPESIEYSRFYNEKEFMLHAKYYTLLVCRLMAIRDKIEIKKDNIELLIDYINSANELIKDLIMKKYKNQTYGETFKKNDLVKDIIEGLGIIK